MINKKVLICSIQRSGTHFLINAISDNFENVSNGWVDIINSKKNKWVQGVTPENLYKKIKRQLIKKYYPHKANKCVKTHYQGYAFEDNIEELLKYYDIFYIIRDPRDSIVSSYHFYNKTNFERFIKEKDFSKFMRKNIRETRSETQPFSYSIIKSDNIIDRWYQHVKSWLPLREKGVHFIKFEDLKNDFQRTIEFIAENSSQKLKKEIVKVPIEDARYRPDYKDDTVPRGQTGLWKEYFNSSDLQFLKDNMVLEDIQEYYQLN